MGLFNWFKKKPSKKDKTEAFMDNLLANYFEGSKEKLCIDAQKLLETTKYNIPIDTMIVLIMRSIGFNELKAEWNQVTRNSLKEDSEGKLPDIELKWMFDYCNFHYVHKNPGKEALLLFEIGGRQVGMPAPHVAKPEDYKDNKKATNFFITDLKENFDYDKSFRKHALTFMIWRPDMEFYYFPQNNKNKPLWKFNRDGVSLSEQRYYKGTIPYLWYMDNYENKESLCWLLDFLDRHNVDIWVQNWREPKNPEALIAEMRQYFPSLQIGNDPKSIETNIQWAWIDLQSMLRFMDFCINTMDWKTHLDNNKVNKLQDCSSLEDLASFMMK